MQSGITGFNCEDMLMSTGRDLILQKGDPLERTIYADDDFAGRFVSYAEIWARVILHNRDPQNPGRTVPKWRSFSEFHYSAIIRAWNVYSAERRLTEIATEIAGSCGDTTYLYLQLHKEYVAFFCCAGGAIENLDGAFASLPDGPPAQFERGLEDEWASLEWMYKRRTQAVHKIVIPFFGRNDVPHFDAKLFADPDSRWFQNDVTDPQCLSDECERIWGKFTGHMAAQWSRLHDIVKKRSPNLTATAAPELKQQQSSGSPSGYPPPSGATPTDHGGS